MKAWHNPNIVSFARAVEAFRSRRDTPRDFLERCIVNIEASETRVKAFATLDLKGARRAASAATRRYKAGAPLSWVDGCPVGIKDIMSTKDMPTQMGSPAFKGWRAKHDAAGVHALRSGGAVILGKTVTTEFAVGYSGPTTNPFDVTRTPGGSSSGSAASVGAGMLPVALGTQTQGSTLRPASYCGAVGYKPSIHALHVGGIHPLSTTCDHLGIIGATLEDIWCVASRISLAAGSPGYGFLEGAAAEPPAPAKPRRLVRLYTRGWAEADGATAQAFETFVQALERSGVEIVSRESEPRVAAYEDALEAGFDGALDIVAYEMKWPFEGYLERFGDVIGDRIHKLIERARAMTPEDYRALLNARTALRERTRALAADTGADGFLTLAASGPAVQGFEFSGSRSFLVPGSWLGLPAFSLPLLESGGLPLGAQILGVPDSDGRLCATARWMMHEYA